MENCLVSKLKGVVNNENIPVLGVFRFYVYPQTSLTWVGLKAQTANASIVKTVSGENFWNSDVNQKYVSVNSGAGFGIPEHGGYIDVTNKYNIIDLSLQNFDQYTEDKRIRMEEFSYMPKLATVTASVTGDVNDWEYQAPEVVTAFEFVHSPNLVGDIKHFKQLVNTTKIRLYNTGCSGDIKDFGSIAGLTSLILQRSAGIGGTVEQFVSEQIKVGRTTCAANTLLFAVGNGNVTYNGSEISSSTTGYLVWAPSSTEGYTTITYNGVNVDIQNPT